MVLSFLRNRSRTDHDTSEEGTELNTKAKVVASPWHTKAKRNDNLRISSSQMISKFQND
jgi:hypothetical protein